MKAPEHLLLMLGGRTEYAKTDYFLKDTGSYSTRHIAEALVRLQPGRFEKLHIFGTSTSGWGGMVLDMIAAQDDQSGEASELLDRITEAIASETMGEDAGLLDEMGKAIGTFLNVPVQCYVLPKGSTSPEFWQMMEALNEIDLPKRVRLSVDLTHGLRTTPVFFFLGLRYLSVVRPGVELANAYYGAFELRDGEGRTPIVDLTAFLELANWIDAARDMKTKADATLLGQLMTESAEEKVYAGAADRYTRALQTNATYHVRQAASDLLRASAGLEEGRSVFKLLQPVIESSPRQISGLKGWRLQAAVAMEHIRYSRPGLALLAAWDAVVERFAEAYEVSTTDREDSKRVSEVMHQLGDSTLDQLRRARNGVAHLRAKKTKGSPRQLDKKALQATKKALEMLENERVINAIAEESPLSPKEE